MVNLGVGRVDILLLDALGTLVEHTGGKADDLAAESNPRENDSAGVSVDEVATVGLVADAGLEEKLCLIAFALGTTGERKAVLQVVAQTELGDDVVTETTAAEVSQTIGSALAISLELALEVFGDPLVDDEHRLTLALLLAFLVGHLAFLYLDVILGCKPAQSFGIGHLFMLHDKGHGVAALAAAKAVASATGRRNEEGGSALIVEGTETLVVSPTLVEGNKFGNYINDIARIFNLLYGLSVYQ